MREEVYRIFGQDGEAFAVSLAGISYCDGSYRIVRKKSETFVIEYVIEGSGTVICDGRSWRARRGDVYMLHEGQAHDYFSDADTPWTKIWFNAHGPLIDALTRAYGLRDAVVFERTDLRSEFEEVLSLCKGGATEKLSERAALIFHRMVQKLAAAQAQDGALTDEAAVMRKYLERKLASRVDIDALAQTIYKSRSQAIRIFRREYGRTPYEYLLERRIALACELLRSTNLLIKEVAYRSGFADEHYFSSVFRRRMGASPREYRRGHSGQRG